MQIPTLVTAGLYTFPNDLSQVPTGALLTADNITMNRNGAAETRRGFGQVGTSLSLSSPQYIQNYFAYQNRLIISDTLGQLWYDSTGAFNWVKYTGTYFPPAQMPKVHGIEANKNFYFATLNGVYKIDAIASPLVLAGGAAALDGTAVLAGDGSGFLGAMMQAVYQVVWGYTDVNGNLILGNPSQRILVSNTTVASDNVNLTTTIPLGLTTNYFYQLYRTPQTVYSGTPSLNVPPGAELQLSAQAFLTGPEIAAGFVTVHDVTIDELLGATLYTSPSQQGPTQTNDPPPLCQDFCVFGGMTFYANVQTAQSTQFNLISVGAPSGIQVGDTLTVNGIIFTGAVAQNNLARQFLVDTTSTVASNIQSTAQNIAEAINRNAILTGVYAFYTSGFNDLPGQLLFQGSTLAQAQFNVTSSRPAAFSPPLPQTSSNDVLPNGIYVSKNDQPEAVPLVNLLLVGGGDQPIQRILPLRDRVVVMKTDGAFTITGDTPQALTITPLDTTIILIAPESARLLNNNIYCETTQGVVAITESGVTIKSRPIEFDILKTTARQYVNFPTATHAISYESERLYLLFTVTNTNDTYATQAWAYNWVTDAWSRWPLDASAGLVNPFDNKLYLARPTNPAFAYQERKSFTLQDYVDDIFPVTITAKNHKVITLNTTQATWVNDYLLQEGLESKIVSVNTGLNQVTLADDLADWLLTDAQVLQPIPINVMWTPITAGAAHFMKNWTRANFWFAGGTFTALQAGFLSDISPYTESVDMTLGSNAPWGLFGWGEGPWGGTSDFAQTIQTLVPRNKSLSHWLQPSVFSSVPYTKIDLLGISMSYDVVSDVMR